MAKKKVKKKKSVNPVDDGPSFEDSLARLEEIAAELEEGSVGLEDALKRYEEGISLLRRCNGLLGNAQRRIELLSGFDADGNPITTLLDDDTLSLTEKAQNRSRRRTANANPKSTNSDSGFANSSFDEETRETNDVDESGRLF